MTLQLTNDDWLIKFDRRLSIDKEHLLGLYSSPFIVVLVQPEVKEPGWTQGGYLAQKIPFNGTIAYASPKSIKLDFLTLLEFSLLPGKNYELYYFPLPRLGSVTINIWEYQGEIKNTSIDELVTSINKADALNLDSGTLKKIEQMLLNQRNQSEGCFETYEEIPLVLL